MVMINEVLNNFMKNKMFKFQLEKLKIFIVSIWHVSKELGLIALSLHVFRPTHEIGLAFFKSNKAVPILSCFLHFWSLPLF